jgi:lysozyme family protein
MNFDAAFDILIDPQHEGGYSFDSADPGGETMYGVTARVAREWGYTGAMRDLPRETAKQIAHDRYWKPAHCDDVPEGLRFDLFDTAYNSGVHEGIVLLQRAAGDLPDGVFGPQTQAALSARDPEWLRRSFNAERLRFYVQLPTWPTFGKGWTERVATNLTRTA